VIKALVAAAAAFTFSVHAEAPPRFAWHLALETAGDRAFYRVEVPAAVYEKTLRADLGDVRILNGDGRAVPFAFLPAPAAVREQAAAVDLPLFPLLVDDERRSLGDLALSVRRDAAGTSVDVKTRDGGAVAARRLAGYLVDAGEPRPPLAALRLALGAASNVDARVRVDGSDDLATWHPLASSAPLIALEYRGQRLVRDRIALTGAPARYLRISFAPSTGVPELAGARGEFPARIVEAQRQWREAQGVADRDHAGEYAFDVGGTFPVDRVTLALPEINTVAPAQVLARSTARDEPNAPDAWRLVGTTVFYRLRQDGGETENPPFAIPVTPRREWKVRIDAHAGAIGGQAPRLSVGWVPHALVFAARGGGPFVLAYGSAQATPAALPIATLVPAFDERTTPSTFGVATPGTAPTSAAGDALRKPVDVKRWLLWITLGFATLVLAWMAIRLSRQMNAEPTRDAPQAAGERASGTPGDASRDGPPPEV
jgi:hypothetical protein